MGDSTSHRLDLRVHGKYRLGKVERRLVLVPKLVIVIVLIILTQVNALDFR